MTQKKQKQKNKTRALQQKVTFNKKNRTISQRVQFASFLLQKNIFFCNKKWGVFLYPEPLQKNKNKKLIEHITSSFH